MPGKHPRLYISHNFLPSCSSSSFSPPPSLSFQLSASSQSHTLRNPYHLHGIALYLLSSLLLIKLFSPLSTTVIIVLHLGALDSALNTLSITRSHHTSLLSGHRESLHQTRSSSDTSIKLAGSHWRRLSDSVFIRHLHTRSSSSKTSIRLALRQTAPSVSPFVNRNDYQTRSSSGKSIRFALYIAHTHSTSDALSTIYIPIAQTLCHHTRPPIHTLSHQAFSVIHLLRNTRSSSPPFHNTRVLHYTLYITRSTSHLLYITPSHHTLPFYITLPGHYKFASFYPQTLSPLPNSSHSLQSIGIVTLHHPASFSSHITYLLYQEPTSIVIQVN